MTGLTALKAKRFTLSDADFRSIRDKVYDLSGILLAIRSSILSTVV